MNRETFLEELERLLADISKEERQEALTFYRNYFEDAGEENEESIIRELESPQKVAESIRGNCMEEEEHFDDRKDDSSKGEYSETEGFAQKVKEKTVNNSFYQEHRTVCVLLMIAGAILLMPVWMSLLGGVFGVILGGFGMVFGILLASIIMTLVFGIGGIALIGVGIGQLFVNVPVGIIVAGIGLLMLAAGILCLLATVWIFGKFIPWLFRELRILWNRLFQKKGVAV